jgi:septin family protein
MAALAKRVVLLPVVSKADAMTRGEAAACVGGVLQVLEAPGELVVGLEPIKPYR